MRRDRRRRDNRLAGQVAAQEPRSHHRMCRMYPYIPIYGANATPITSLTNTFCRDGAKKTRRPQSLPPPRTDAPRPASLHVPGTGSPNSIERPQSRGDGRRISFGSTPRPDKKFVFSIPTKNEPLSSGFQWDGRLALRYGVSEEMWKHFSREVLDAVEVPGPSWTWRIHKRNVIKRIKKDLVYESDLKSTLKKWNRLFSNRHGFKAYLKVPDERGEEDISDEDVGNDEAERQQALLNARRFRIVINSNTEKASSVYSRSSSVTRTVSGEATAVQKQVAADAVAAKLEGLHINTKG